MHLLAITIGSTIVDFKPTVDMVMNTISSLVLAAVVPWVAAKVLQKLHIDKQSALGLRLIQAAENGASFALAKATDLADAHSNIDVKNQLAAAGAAYVQRALPDTLKALGITPDHLQNIVLAKIQQQLPLQVSATPVVAPAAPIQPVAPAGPIVAPE